MAQAIPCGLRIQVLAPPAVTWTSQFPSLIPVLSYPGDKDMSLIRVYLKPPQKGKACELENTIITATEHVVRVQLIGVSA